MIKITLTICLSLCTFYSSFSQQTWEKDCLKSGIQQSFSDYFEVQNSNYLKDHPRVRYVLGTCVSPVLTSFDGEFVAMLFMIAPRSHRDSLRFFNRDKDPKYPHIHSIKYNLSDGLGLQKHIRESAMRDAIWNINIRKHVHYYSHEEAKKMFNADTLITYPLKNIPYKEKYTNCQTWVLQKQDRGFVKIFCFFTDKGISRKKKYLKLLQKSMRYDDIYTWKEEPFEPSWVKYIRKMNLEQKFDENFVLKDTSIAIYSIMPTRPHEDIFAGIRASPLLEAHDGHFTAMFNFFIHSSDDVEFQNSYIKRNLTYTPELIALDDSAYHKMDIRDYVHYYSPEESKSMFNADTVIGFPLSLKEKPYREKFTQGEIFILQKQDRGFVLAICLFTDEGILSRDKYLKKLQESLKYK